MWVRGCMAPSQIAMEDQKASSSGGGDNWGHLETIKADHVMWLMKCPPNVAKSLKGDDADAASASAGSDPCSSVPVAKVVLSLDPLNSNDDAKVLNVVVFASWGCCFICACIAVSVIISVFLCVVSPFSWCGCDTLSPFFPKFCNLQPRFLDLAFP